MWVGCAPFGLLYFVYRHLVATMYRVISNTTPLVYGPCTAFTVQQCVGAPWNVEAGCIII